MSLKIASPVCISSNGLQVLCKLFRRETLLGLLQNNGTLNEFRENFPEFYEIRFSNFVKFKEILKKRGRTFRRETSGRSSGGATFRRRAFNLPGRLRVSSVF